MLLISQVKTVNQETKMDQQHRESCGEPLVLVASGELSFILTFKEGSVCSAVDVTRLIMIFKIF